MARFGAIVLTQGRRPADLRRVLQSLLCQQGVEVDIVVVGNAWQPTNLPAGVRALALATDVGIPGGKNAGVPYVDGDLLLFLDDDVSLLEPDALQRVARELAADGQLGMLTLHVEALSGPPLRSWMPRLRVGDRERSSDVTTICEGAVAMPRAVFEQVGGWPGHFRFVHEGIDFAWRVMDAGYRIRYAGDVIALHPAPEPARHSYSAYFGARNRVWLARRHLPLALGALYVVSFALRSLPALRSTRDARALLRGYRDGVREPCGERRTLRARTLWRMTRAGRPPIL